MKKIYKILISILLVFNIGICSTIFDIPPLPGIFASSPSPSSGPITDITDTLTISIAGGGNVTVTGRVNPEPTGTLTEVGFMLITRAAADQLIAGTMPQNPMDWIAFIDQHTAAVTGDFTFSFKVASKFFGTEMVLRIGIAAGGPQNSSVEGVNLSGIYIPIVSMETIQDNVLRVGNDIYSMDSSNFTRDHVTTSIIEGGNIVWFKIGGNWYNVLDKDCTSNEYFITSHKLTSETMNNLPLQKYYGPGTIILP